MPRPVGGVQGQPGPAYVLNVNISLGLLANVMSKLIGGYPGQLGPA